MNRRPLWPWLLLTAGLSLIASWFIWRPLLGDDPLGPPRPPPLPLSPEAAAIYNTPVHQVHFASTPLDAAIEQLRQKSGQKIFVNWRAAQSIGVNKDTRVTIDLSSSHLADVLTALLTQVSNQRLGFEMDEGVVDISTKADLDGRNVITRVYDIRNLVADPPSPGIPHPYNYGPGYPLNAPLRRSWTPLDRFTYFDSRVIQDRINALITSITQAIDPPSWRDKGGSIGGIRAVSGQLIVTQTPENQAEVVYFLNRQQWKIGVRSFAIHSVALLLLSLLTVRLIAIPLTRGRRRLEKGLCVNCGYDLRATTDRCPECGEAKIGCEQSQELV